MECTVVHFKTVHFRNRQLLGPFIVGTVHSTHRSFLGRSTSGIVYFWNRPLSQQSSFRFNFGTVHFQNCPHWETLTIGTVHIRKHPLSQPSTFYVPIWSGPSFNRSMTHIFSYFLNFDNIYILYWVYTPISHPLGTKRKMVIIWHVILIRI